MKNLVYLATALLAGGATAIQVAVNARLRGYLNHPMLATLISFSVGTLAAVLFCLSQSVTWPEMSELRKAPWWAWVGGLLGVIYIWSTIIISPRVGVAVWLGLVIAGQMLMSLLMDHYGWLGVQAQPVSWTRSLGVLLIVVGAALLSWTKAA